MDRKESLIFKVIDIDSEQVIGHISLGRIDRINDSARIGKVLVDPTMRGKGIGVQMIQSVLRIGFEDLNLHRIGLGVFDFNHSAIACYEKAGLKKEGLIRDVRKIGSEYWSLYEMSILEDEWRLK